MSDFYPHNYDPMNRVHESIQESVKVQESVKATFVHAIEIPRRSSLTRVSPVYERRGYRMQIQTRVNTRDSEVYVWFYVEGAAPLISPEVMFTFEGVHRVNNIQVLPTVASTANNSQLVYHFSTSLQMIQGCVINSTVLLSINVKLYA